MSDFAVLARRRHWGADGGAALVVGAAALLAVAAVAYTASAGISHPSVAMVFGAMIVLGEVVRVRLPGDREAAPVGVASALGYALLVQVGESHITVPVAEVVAVTSLAALIGALPHVIAGRSPHHSDVARRVIAVAAAAVAFQPLHELTDHPHLATNGALLALTMIGAALVSGLVDAFVSAIARADRHRAPFLTTLRDELRALMGLGAAIGATGVVIALAAGRMGLWALPVFAVPLLVTQFSFKRFAAIRATYLQTIRALSRVTEVGGYVEPGHSRRVSTLSVAVGRELGMSEAELLDLEYAALMHDIGQLSFTDPVPGGATIVVAPQERRRIAELGAEVIRRAGALEHVADIVERQSDPYRRHREGPDESLPIASRIIKATNAFDDLVSGSSDPDVRADAMERLRLGMAYEYDPWVVEALSRVVTRVRV